MTSFHVTRELVEEYLCLNRQVVYREACRHAPKHGTVADLIVARYAAQSPRDVQERMRAACAPRGSGTSV